MAAMPDSQTVTLLVSVRISQTVDGRALIRVSDSEDLTRKG
jgi:hypothetical protein